jgi:hypothetical protein
MKPPNASPCSGPSISMPIGLPTFPGGMLPMQHTPTSNPGQLPPFAQSLLIQQMIQNQNQLRRIGVNPLQLGTVGQILINYYFLFANL